MRTMVGSGGTGQRDKCETNRDTHFARNEKSLSIVPANLSVEPDNGIQLDFRSFRCIVKRQGDTSVHRTDDRRTRSAEQ